MDSVTAQNRVVNESIPVARSPARERGTCDGRTFLLLRPSLLARVLKHQGAQFLLGQFDELQYVAIPVERKPEAGRACRAVRRLDVAHGSAVRNGSGKGGARSSASASWRF
jgi:hypothetical protein